MLKKEIRIAAKLDTGDFDKTVESMQRKMKDIYGGGSVRSDVGMQDRMAKHGMGPGATEAQRRQADVQDKQRYRDVLGAIKEQERAEDQILKKLKEKEAIIDRISKKQAGGKLYSAESDMLKKTQQEKEQLEAQQAQLRNNRMEGLNIADQLRPRGAARIMNAYDNGGIGGGARAFGRELMQSPAFLTTVLGATLGVAQAGSAIYADRVSMPRQITESAGSASITGSDRLSQLFSGRSVFENVFSKEYTQASNMAQEEKKRQRTSDKADASLSILGNVLAGATAGGIGGSIFGGLGAIPGAVLGGAAGLTRGVINNSDQALSGFGLFDNNYKKRYENRLEAQSQQNRKSAEESLRNLDPMRKFGTQYFEQNYQRDLGLQRQLGLNDKELSGFFGDAGEFTRNQQIESAQGIISSGGSTQAGRGLASFSNRLGRDYRLTNSSQLLGAMSGSLGDAQSSSNALIKILAEGTRLGFDTSKNTEELRRFAQAATDIATRSGTRSERSAGEIGSRFSDFVSGNTMTDIGNARSAYQTYQGLASESNGPRGVMQAVGMMNDKDLGKLNRNQAYSLQNMTPEQIMAGGPEIEAMAAQAGLSLEDFKKKAIEVKDNSINIRGSTDKTRDELKNRIQTEFGGDYEKAMQDPSFRIEAGKYASALRVDRGVLAKTSGREMEAVLAGDLSGRSASGLSTQMPAAQGEMIGDKVNRGIAEGEKEVNKAVYSMLGEFENASKGIKRFADFVIETTNATRAKIEKDPSNAGRYVQDANAAIGAYETGVQPTAGTPRK